MLKIFKDYKNSIKVEVDLSGIAILKSAIELCLKNNNSVITTITNGSIGFKSKPIFEIQFILSNRSCIYQNSNILYIEFELEDLIYFQFRIGEANEKKIFYPADVLNLGQIKRKEDFYVFFEVKDNEM